MTYIDISDFKVKYDNFLNKYGLNIMLDCLYKSEYEKNSVKPLKDKEHLFFVTVCPKPSVPFEAFLKKCHKLLSRDICGNDAHFTIEQRGENLSEVGKGFHAHFLFRKRPKYSPSELKRDLKNTFKDMTNNSENTLNVKVYPISFWQDKLDYLKGIKNDIEKSDKLECDKIFRKNNFLLDIYSKWQQAH